MHIRYKLYLGKIREAPIRVPLTRMFEVFLCLSVVGSSRLGTLKLIFDFCYVIGSTNLVHPDGK